MFVVTMVGDVNWRLAAVSMPAFLEVFEDAVLSEPAVCADLVWSKMYCRVRVFLTV